MDKAELLDLIAKDEDVRVALRDAVAVDPDVARVAVKRVLRETLDELVIPPARRM